MMNDVPIDMVCFGNHECDVPHEALVDRIAEFKGIWLNSNMPTFTPRTPAHQLVELEGGRSVALIGLNIGGGTNATVYRKGAFNGHASQIVPVLEAVDGAVAAAREAYPHVDCVIPLTHQDLADDIAMTAMGHGFPVVLGGHDHEENTEHANGSVIVKAGIDASKVVVIDLVWAAGSPKGVPPTEVIISYEWLAAGVAPRAGAEATTFEPDPAAMRRMKRWMQPIDELKVATLHRASPGRLSSVGVRKGKCTMATFLLTCLRKASGVDAALINAGSVRGDRVYDDGEVTYGDLTKECPFPSQMLCVLLDGATLAAAIEHSRRPWQSVPPTADADSLHTDDMLAFNAEQDIVAVGGRCFAETEMYEVLIDAYIMSSNPALVAYSESHPERIPPLDSGKAPLPLLVQYFVEQIWAMLLTDCVTNSRPGSLGDLEPARSNSDYVRSFFERVDSINDDHISVDELRGAIIETLGPSFASRVVTSQCMVAVDSSGDGLIGRAALKSYLTRKRTKVPIQTHELLP